MSPCHCSVYVPVILIFFFFLSGCDGVSEYQNWVAGSRALLCQEGELLGRVAMLVC